VTSVCHRARQGACSPSSVRAKANDHGFTLVESVIACALLATALLSIGHLSATSIAQLSVARNRTRATMIAVATLEELRTAAAPAAGGDTVDNLGQPVQQQTLWRFERRWSVASLSADTGILTVVVTPLPPEPGREIRLTGGWLAKR